MDVKQVIETSRSLAQRFKSQGHEQVRLPVFTFDDWRAVYDRPSDGSSLAQYLRQVKQNWYLMHFLRALEVEVLPVPVTAGAFAAWAKESEHSLSDGHELAHAVGDYVNDPNTPVSACRHGALNPDFDGLGGMATITVLGEDEDTPEVMTVVQHTRDGQVLQSLQMAAIDYSPQAAWDEAKRFLARVRPDKVFHDEKIRKPEYCTDCNGLLVSVASPEDVAASN